LEHIAQVEGVRLQKGVSDALVQVAEGDLRKAITFLQSAARLVGSMETKKGANEDEMDMDDDDTRAVSVRSIQEIAGVIPIDVLEGLLDAIHPRIPGKVQYDKISKVVEDMVADGWSAAQTVAQLYDRVLYDERIGDLQKSKIAMAFSEVDKRLVDGADEHLAILDLALRVAGVLADG
jgi:DNA polymerase III delta prime subunit